MTIVETSIFERKIDNLLSVEEYRLLQLALMRNPESGAIIKRGGGIRKFRWGTAGRGKRGGVRVMYYMAVKQDDLLMLYVFGKNEQDDLTDDQLHILKKTIQEEYR